jgi:sulfoxide reductase heme-binding subunit YedZ
MEGNPHFFWEVSRASGLVAFVLLWLSTALGLGITSRASDPLAPRAWVFETHKFTSLLALAFVGVHALSLIPDPATDFRLAHLFLPAGAPYRPLAVALGVLAMYGLAVSAGSFYVKKRIGHRTWRALHYATFATFALALYHGVFAGTDSPLPWIRWVYIGAFWSVLGLTLYRVLAAPEPRRRAQEAA